MNVLVIDIGSSSMRGILYRENGKKIFTKQIHYQPVHDENGKVEQNPKDFEDALLKILKSVSGGKESSQAEIDVISITAQRSSVIPVDDAGIPLMNAIMWQDTRNQRICEKLQVYNEKIRKISGANVNCVFSGGKMSWIKNSRPDIYEKIYKMVNIPEYLIYLMTGNFVTDYTYGSRSNLMNLRTCEWDEELLQLFQVNREHLCTLKAPGEIHGYITKEFAKRAGIHQGIPVISAGGDQQCAAIGHGAYREGTISIVTGTGAFLVTTCNKIPEKLPENIICNCSSIKGKYVMETNVLTCCSAFDWFCKTFYDWEKIDYNKVNRDLEKIYGKKSMCTVLPYFQGRSTPDWNPTARASFHNISLGTGREEVLKAILEGIFMEIDNNIQLFKECADIKEANISGGLTNSRLLNQMQADIYGIPLTHYEDSESTANGAFMITMQAMGKGGSLDEIYDRVYQHNSKEQYKVNYKIHQDYIELKKEMNQLYKKIYKEENLK